MRKTSLSGRGRVLCLAALGAVALVSSAGAWVRAQESAPAAPSTETTEAGAAPDGDGPEGAPAPASARAATAARPVVDRERVPSVAELQVELTRLRADALTSAGGPALEHAALALERARQAESAHGAGARDAADQALRARRIAYAALTLASAQRERERARLARDEASRDRHGAEGDARVAAEALARARENAAGVAAVATPAPPSPGTPSAESAPAAAVEETP